MTDNDRIRFEKYMVNVEKIIVGSSDPYPQELEKRYWKVWCAALETPPKPTWTKADQEKGILPTVGCLCIEGMYPEEVIAVTSKYIVTKTKTDGVCTTSIETFKRTYRPIETPREKYDRERDECIDKLLAKVTPMRSNQTYGMKIMYEELRPFTGDNHD